MRLPEYEAMDLNYILSGAVRHELGMHDPQYDLKLVLSSHEVLGEDDLALTSAFITRCLHLDPNERPSANQLLEDPWLR